MTPPPEANRIGEIVGGKYRIVRLLAKGGMGLVYEAQHAVVRRRFAIKFLRRELAERRDILTRFQREAEAAGALENENVAAAIDFGIADDSTPYIVMEYLAGESLDVLLEREGRLPVTRAADITMQACRGVAAAHAADIIHRDLKPDNLFVSRRDDGSDLVKVLDFGVAKLQFVDDASAATRTGTVLGTVAYMAPEQARGEKVVDSRTDVYALGAIFYELVSQQRPHPGDSQTAILHHIASYAAVPLDSVQSDLPAGLGEVVDGVLASDRAQRPATAHALSRALAPFARREIWPPPPDHAGRAHFDLVSTLPAPGEDRDDQAFSSGPAPRGPTAGHRASKHRERSGLMRSRVLLAGALLGAVAQLASLRKADDRQDSAQLTAMVATPSVICFVNGSPEQVRAQVIEVIKRGQAIVILEDNGLAPHTRWLSASVGPAAVGRPRTSDEQGHGDETRDSSRACGLLMRDPEMAAPPGR